MEKSHLRKSMVVWHHDAPQLLPPICINIENIILIGRRGSEYFRQWEQQDLKPLYSPMACLPRRRRRQIDGHRHSSRWCELVENNIKGKKRTKQPVLMPRKYEKKRRGCNFLIKVEGILSTILNINFTPCYTSIKGREYSAQSSLTVHFSSYAPTDHQPTSQTKSKYILVNVFFEICTSLIKELSKPERW